jgi:tryptophan-rich sensory protein
MKEIAQKTLENLTWIENILGGVWLFLFGLMLIAAYIVFRKTGWSRQVLLIIIIMLATFSYPLYTFGFKLIPCLIGNLSYIALISYVLTKLRKEFPSILYLLLPIIIWSFTATIYVSAEIIVRYS